MQPNLLSGDTRHEFETLLDALILNEVDVDLPAIIFVQTGLEPFTISRLEFRCAVQNYAAALDALGIKQRDLVVIAHTQNLESIYAFWGALLIGAIPSMFPTLTEKLDPAIYTRNMAELVRISKVRAVVTTDDFAPLLGQVVGCPVFGSTVINDHAHDHHLTFNDISRSEANQVAFLQHSSGTTGLQKGVALAHLAVLNQLASYSDAIHLRKQDVVVSWLPLYHDMGLIAGFLLPLVQGIPLVLMSPFDWVRHPALMLRAINDHAGTLCWLPNFAYNHSARRVRRRDSDGLSLSSMRMFINCSEPVHHSSHQLFLERFKENGVKANMLGVSYAMAENTFGVTQTEPGHPPVLDHIDAERLRTAEEAVTVAADAPTAATKVSCGPPIRGTEIRIVSKKLKKQPDRIVGEIALRGDAMLKEYYRRPDLQPFHNGWFLTGDRGYVADGELFVIGRSKDLIINAGKNVYPQDIEAIINDVDGVHVGRAVVFGVPDRKEGTELVAVVAEVSTQDSSERKEIAKRIRQEVSRQSMITVSYVDLVGPKWLIKTSSGKIARAANRNKWLRSRDNLAG